MHNSVGLCWCRAGIADTCLALVTDRSTETLPSLRHVSYAAEGTTFVSTLMHSHTTRSIALSVLWHTDAHKYDQGHMVERQGYPQALLRKSYMCDKWSEGLPISRVWWCFRINCKVLCLVYYYSVGPYIAFIFLIGYFPGILKISYMCDKWSEGFPISRVWWCFRMNCKVLCLVYYYSVGPYIAFIFLIGYFPGILKITKIQTIFKKIMQCVMQCVICCAQNTWNL